MLTRIFIQNFALIDSLEIDLHAGLQVITGETGAGKSIILGALRLILGERADAKSIQNSDSKSIVEAEFILNENFRSLFEAQDVDFEKNTLIRREILPSGKSRAFINDTPVTLEVLREIATRLVDIHSQFETANLFNDAYQFRIIDGLAGNFPLLEEYQTQFSEFKKLQRELEKLKNSLSESAKESDYQNFILNELNEAQLDEVDLEDLQSRLSIQENAELISENFAQILARTNQDEVGVMDHFAEIRSRLAKNSELSQHYQALSERFEAQYIEFRDFISEIETEGEKIETDPALQAELSAKISALHSLLLKHNSKTIPELIAIRDGLAQKQDSFADIETRIADIENLIKISSKKVEDFARKLAQNRKKTAPVFTEKIETLLKQLGLEKAKIDVELSESPGFNEFGREDIKILFQANSGFPMKPIQSAISGGERSRVMLAVKKIMAENASLPTLILDEIDTGVSGKVADEMGKVMRAMSQDMQLIVITHLAQVAAKGDNNYKVKKLDADGKTQTTIVPLSSEDKLSEIAQLLSGSKITDAALQQARELMN